MSDIKHHIMRQTLFILGLIFLVSCKKDTSPISASGLYVENTPVAGRSQLNFISNNLVVKSETGSSYKDTFSFSISSGKILLTPTWTTQYSGQQFDFEKIDDKTIKIENLYPSIPEAPKSYMTFKK
ncbi:hypothetical protein GOQ04_25095 [Emticicia sp. ODNR4P]|nr:hypothetical protein [Emticicia sp. ODNR4P]